MTESIRLSAAALKPSVVALPGSKSISNRTLLLAALSDNACEIRSLLSSDDTARMLEALTSLGVKLEPLALGRIKVHGCGGRFPERRADLFLGNAGTAFRPLTAALAVLGGDYRLHGVPRMHERPIGDLVDALRIAGADVQYLGNEGYPPLQINERSDKGARVIPIKGNVSSQFLTALLMALPLTGEAFGGRTDFQALYRHHFEIDGAIRCAGGKRKLSNIQAAGRCALPCPRSAACGRRCFERLLFSCRRPALGCAHPRNRHRPPQYSGRCGLCARIGKNRCQRDLGR